jgi:hypothetical protein
MRPPPLRQHEAGAFAGSSGRRLAKRREQCKKKMEQLFL